MKTKLVLITALALLSSLLCVRADIFDRIASEQQTNKPAHPIMTQTNAPNNGYTVLEPQEPVSVFVEVPSFTIAFPGSMTPSEISDVLKKYYGTNLTFIFTVTNGQTHEQLKFTSNSMPSMDKLRQLFAVQRQNPPPSGFILDATPAPEAEVVSTNPPVRNPFDQFDQPQTVASATLTAFRKKYPQFAKIPDSQVVLAIGRNSPIYLQQDKQFAEEFALYSALEKSYSVSNSSSDSEERKTAALERQADALERQANALEDQTFAQERAANAAEDQEFQQEMLNDDIDFRLDMSQIQNMTPPLTSPTLPIIPIAPIQQPDHPRLIIVPGQGTYVVSPERPGQPQIITGPGLKGPIIVSP